MPSGLLKFLGFLLLLGSVGVVGVQGCTSKSGPRDVTAVKLSSLQVPGMGR